MYKEFLAFMLLASTGFVGIAGAQLPTAAAPAL